MTYSLQEGRSPLYVAVEQGHTEAVDILITHNADLNTVNRVRELVIDTHAYILVYQSCHFDCGLYRAIPVIAFPQVQTILKYIYI